VRKIHYYKIHYYKCIGSDGWRKLGGPVCDNRRLVQQNLLDQIVLAEVILYSQNTRAIRRLRLSSMVNVLPCAIDSLGTPAGLCHGPRQSRVVGTQRIPSGREPHP
jgi:hypothetical protein